MRKIKLLITLAALLLPFAGHAQILTNLPAASSVAGTDIYPTTQGGTTTRKATAAQLYTYIETSLLPGNLTWTGVPTYSLAEPRVKLSETDAATDEKLWDWDVQGKTSCFRTRTDADGAGVNFLCQLRGTGTAVSTLTIGSAAAVASNYTNTGTHTFSGAVTSTGNVASGNVVSGTTATFGGAGSFGRVIVTSGTVPTNGMMLAAASTLGFAANSSTLASWTTTQLTVNTGVQSGGTKFTASGCSNSTTVGGAIAGQYTSGTTGTCTVTITLPTATNGWACQGSDMTTTANLISQSASTTTSCTLTGTTVSGDVITFSAMGF